MYVKVTAQPGARKETIHEAGDRGFVIAVREEAQQNRANTRIRELLADRFKVPLSAVRILTGHRSRSKILSIDN